MKEPTPPDATASGVARWFLPRTSVLLWLAVFLGLTLTPAASALISSDGDLALHLVIGQLTLGGGIPARDPSCFQAPDTPFIAHEWGSQVLLALSERGFGLAGPALLAALLTATAAALLLWRAGRQGARPLAAFAAILPALPVVAGHLHARPHLMGWLLLTLWLALLEARRRGLALRPVLVVGAAIALVWANVHGGFLLMFVTLTLSLAADVVLALNGQREARQRLPGWLGLGALCLLLTGLNPHGFALHAHLGEWVGNPFLAATNQEFQSPDFHQPMHRLYLVYLCWVWGVVGISQKRLPLVAVLQLLCLMGMSLISMRHASLFALVSAPLVAGRLEGLLTAPAEGWLAPLQTRLAASSENLAVIDRRFRGEGLAAIFAALVLGLAAIGGLPASFDPQQMPVAALDHVEQHPERFAGRPYNAYLWGGYLAWRQPGRQTFIHSFTDHLGEEVMRRFALVHGRGEGWLEILEQQQVEWAIDHPGSGVLRGLRAAGWREDYADDTAVILLRPGDTP